MLGEVDFMALDFLKDEINSLKEQNLFTTLPVMSTEQAARVTLNGKKVIMLCSNNYLGFANNPRIREAAKRAIDKWGFGTGAVRQIAGTMDIHMDFEKQLAVYKETKSALMFTAGIAANRGTIQALFDKGDVIISDELNHGSIIDGVRLTKADRKIYQHGNMDELKQALEASKGARRILVVTDGVFSMDGDIAPLDQIVELAEQYGAVTMVDDAHGDGVLGKDGRGIISHYKLEGRVDIDMGTFSKAFGCIGGYIAGEPELTDYLVNRARSFIFTTGHPPATIAACSEALTMIQDEPHHLKQLWENRNYLKEQLQSLGFDTGNSKTPITPVMLGESSVAQRFSKALFEHGVWAKPIVFPLVAKDKARIRTMVTAQHTKEDLDEALDAFKKVGRDLKVIS